MRRDPLYGWLREICEVLERIAVALETGRSTPNVQDVDKKQEAN
jgi:hypothetical protein